MNLTSPLLEILGRIFSKVLPFYLIYSYFSSLFIENLIFLLYNLFENGIIKNFK